MSWRWVVLEVASTALILGTVVWVLLVRNQPDRNERPRPDQATLAVHHTQRTEQSPQAAHQGEAVSAQLPGTGVQPQADPSGRDTPSRSGPAKSQSPGPAARSALPVMAPEPAGPEPNPSASGSAPPEVQNDPLALYTDENAVRMQEQEYGDVWARPVPVPPEAQGLPRLTKDNGVWVDRKGRRVIVAGRVVLRRGALEMFACPKFTKEHESIVSVNAPAHVVHAALLALGVEPGRPVRFDPQYQPATGPEIQVKVCWTDPKGKRRCVPAQKWVRHIQTGKELQFPWIFTGSTWWESPDKKERYYMADQGDFICVSNFPTAMLDLPIRSSSGNAELLFEAFTVRIPPVGTDVALVLQAAEKPSGVRQSQDEK